jgi:transcriptional regulator with XRE-family HTH domain
MRDDRAMDDIRIGRVCRALRRRSGWRQLDLAGRAGCHQTTISRLERGQLGSLSVRLLRRVFQALGAQYSGVVSWRGADVDRLLDERHAMLVESATDHYRRHGWEVAPEVSFSVYGERGSIDLLAVRRASGIPVVNEMKTAIGGVEDTLRRHDAKVRLAPQLVRDRFGFTPSVVIGVLVVLEDRTNRRIVERHRRTFEAAYQDGTRATTRMVRTRGERAPAECRNGIWFLSPKPGRHRRHRNGGPTRVRVPRPSVK